MAGKFFEDMGDEVMHTETRLLAEADLDSFLRLSGMRNRLFTNEVEARRAGFASRLIPGPLVLTVAMGLIENLGILDESLIALSEVRARFYAPTRVGDTIAVESKVKEKRETSKRDRGLVAFEDIVTNQTNEKVMQVERLVLVRRKVESHV